MLRESDFGGRKHFVRKFHSPPPTRESTGMSFQEKKSIYTSGVAVDLVNINNNL